MRSFSVISLLRPLRAAALLLLVPLGALAAPLVTPAELAPRLTDPALRVLDIRDAKAYEAGHLPGSLSAPYGKWRGEPDNPGAAPTPARLTELLQSLGLEAATPIVVVYEGSNSTDFGGAARVYWTLKAGGLHHLSILNGGVTAWRAAQQPLVTTPAPVVARSSYVVSQLDPKLFASRADVHRLVESKQSVLLDARPENFFKGETKAPAAALAGTIAGATNLDNAVWFAPGSGALLEPAQLQTVAKARGVDLSQPTVSFCNTGHWAATNWFVLSEMLGQKDVRLYPDSLVEWSKQGEPMDNVPGRATQLWQQIKSSVTR